MSLTAPTTAGSGGNETVADLAIIGAGPTGLFAAYYAGFRDLSTVLIDSLPEAGGQVSAMYPEKLIFDVAGFPSVRGRDLIAALVTQAERYHPRYLLERQARTLAADGDRLVLGLADGSTVRCGAVLITAGMGEFTPRPLPAAEGYTGAGVVNFVPRLDAHAGEDVVIVGGGDSAFDWAMSLHPIAGSVTLVHRRATFRAHPGTIRAVRDLGIPVITDAAVSALRHQDGVLTEVELAITPRSSPPSSRVIPARTVVAALGFTADLGPIESWGFTVERRAVPVDTTMRTDRPRVYAAGDVAAYPGKVKLIATGFGEAATAVNNIAVELDPTAHLFPGHSSNA